MAACVERPVDKTGFGLRARCSGRKGRHVSGKALRVICRIGHMQIHWRYHLPGQTECAVGGFDNSKLQKMSEFIFGYAELIRI